MGDRVPHRTLEIGQKASVEILGPPTQPVDAAVVVTETHQVRVADAREPRQETVEARERFVAVARDRPPHVAFRCVEARPPPLIGMAIAVTEQEVEQARREERAGIHPLTRAAPSQVQQAVRARDLARACEPARTARSLARALLEDPQHAGELWAEVAEARIGRQPARVFVHGAKHVFATVRAGEAERARLGTTAAPQRSQAAGEGSEVEQLHLDRRGPEVTVVAAEQHLMQPPGPILGTGGDGGWAGGGGRGRAPPPPGSPPREGAPPARRPANPRAVTPRPG